MGYAKQTLSAAGAVVIRMCDQPNNQDNVAVVEVSGTYTSVTAAFEGTMDPTSGSTLFQNILGIRYDTGATEQTPTMTNATTRKWQVPIQGLAQFELNISVLGSNSITVEITTFFQPGGFNFLTQTSTISTAQNITSSSATAFTVGQNGTTNPAFQVNANASTSTTGLEVSSAATGSGVALQAITGGTNEVLTIDAAAAALVKIGSVASTALGLQVGSSTAAAGTQLIVQSTNAAALVVGRQGGTSPAFQVNANASTSTTGLKVTAAANAAGVAVAGIGGNGNENLTFDTVGSGIVTIASVSTGGCNVRVPVQTVAVSASGNAIGNATNVVEGYTYVTSANNVAAIKLPLSPGVGTRVTINNTVQTAVLPIFPAVNASINNLAANAVYNIANGAERTFTAASATQWYASPQTIT